MMVNAKDIFATFVTEYRKTPVEIEGTKRHFAVQALTMLPLEADICMICRSSMRFLRML